MPDGLAWARIAGDGRLVRGRCLVGGFLIYIGNNGNQVKIYDGVSVGQGELFTTVTKTPKDFVPILFPSPVEFSSGVYIDASNSNDVTTVLFEQLE